MEIISTVLLTVGVFVFLACWAAAIVMIRNDAFGARPHISAPVTRATVQASSDRQLETSGAR